MTTAQQKNLVISCVLSSKGASFLWLQLSYPLVIFISKDGLLTMLFFTVGLHFCGSCNLYSNLASLQIHAVREAPLSRAYTPRKVKKKLKNLILQINEPMWKKNNKPKSRSKLTWVSCLVIGLYVLEPQKSQWLYQWLYQTLYGMGAPSLLSGST